MDDYAEKYLTNNIHDSLKFKDPPLCQGLTSYYTSMGVTQYCHSVIISPVHVEGDLIVGTRLQFRMYGLSCLFSLKPRKICHPWKSKQHSCWASSLLLRIWSLQSTAHLKPFLRNFVVYQKHVRHTPGSSNSSFQDLVVDFQCLFYTNHEFENRTFVWVRLIFFLFGEFDFVRLSNSIELNPWIEFDWVRLGSIEIEFDWVRFTMPWIRRFCTVVSISVLRFPSVSQRLARNGADIDPSIATQTTSGDHKAVILNSPK